MAPAGLQPADPSDPAISLALVPRLACQLHPWTPPPVRRAAATGLASLLLGAWQVGRHDPNHHPNPNPSPILNPKPNPNPNQAGRHDPVLLFLLEASLAARRLAFALPLLARETGPEGESALEAAIF